MAQKDLKFLWGTNSKMSGTSAPTIVDGKAYFAIVDGTTKYPDSAPANEAFIYLDKDNKRYNVIAKRAIFDALGNKIHTKYATEIDASGNTMTLYAPGDAGNNATALGSASIIQAVALATDTTNATTYKIKATVNGVASNAYALVAADSEHAGIVTASGTQDIAGIKKFVDTTNSTTTATGAVVVAGGVGIAKQLVVGDRAIVDRIAISNTGSVAHLQFSRSGLNYIQTVPDGFIGFLPNGKDLSAANCDLIIKNGSVYPGTSNLVGLGDSSHQWQTVYSRYYRSIQSMGIESGSEMKIDAKGGLYLQWLNTAELYFQQKNSTSGATTTVGRFKTDGSLLLYSHLLPASNSSIDIGSSSYKWRNVYATTFTGNLTGKLTTARNISLGTGATSTPVGFDGSADIVLPVTGIKEAYLTWGGKNISGSAGPLDASLIANLGANRFAFLSPNKVTLLASKDSGATWTEVDDTVNKKKLFRTIDSNFTIGNDATTTKVNKTNYLSRVIVTTSNHLYAILKKFALYISSEGSSGCYCTIEARTKADQDANNNTWKMFAERVSMSGWSGWNIINLTEYIQTHGNTTSQYSQIRFTFGVTSHPATSAYSGFKVYGIMAFGETCWQPPSTMAKDGHLYTYDYDGNATFPGRIAATAFRGNLGITNKTYTSTAAYQYLMHSGAVSGDNTVNASENLYLYATDTASWFNVGKGNKGGITLHNGSGLYVNISPTTLTAQRSITLPDAGGTVLTSDYFADYVSPRTHKHKVTHTPAGTVAAPVFTGTSVNTGATSSTVSVGSSAHVHTYDKLTTINAPTFGHTATASAGPSDTTTVYSITNVGSAPSLSMSVTNHQLQISFSAGSVPTRSGVTVPNSTHTHNYDKLTSIAAPTFSHTSTNSGKPSATTSVPTAAHIHAVTAAGTNSAPAFTGTAATLTTTTQV